MLGIHGRRKTGSPKTADVRPLKLQRIAHLFHTHRSGVAPIATKVGVVTLRQTCICVATLYILHPDDGAL
jgi:hypothetical protein